MEIGIEAAPSKVFLNIGELTESVAFDDLSDISWSCQTQGQYDLEYVYIDTYKKTLLQYQTYKNVAKNAQSTLRDYRHAVLEAVKSDTPKEDLIKFLASWE